MRSAKTLYIALLSVGMLFSSCDDFYDVNDDPNNIKNAPVSVILPAATVNIGFMGGSDLLKYSATMMQQLSGHGPANPSTVEQYERYNINNSDVNNLWNKIFGQVLADLEQVILKSEGSSPHYAGVAKILKAYTYQVTIDAWGDVPYSEAQKFLEVLYPAFDDDAAIYPELIKLIDAGIADINAPVSTLSPNAFSTIYRNSSNWAPAQAQWLKFANTLKLRLFLHYSEVNPAFATEQINALVNGGAIFMESPADNFQMMFSKEPLQQNPISSIEGGQFRNQLFPHRTIVNMMNAKADPRRTSFFVPFPYNATPPTYKGASVLDKDPSSAYSRLHSYLKGTPSGVNPELINPDGSLKDDAITYGGDAPVRLLTFAEYNFIRAEAALRFGAPGDANAFYQAGIRASMQDAGIAQAEAEAYLAANGTLAGSPAAQLEQIITEKYIANFGVMMEPWTDWRRTGYPAAVSPLSTPIAAYEGLPRTLLYPTSETASNPNIPQRTTMLDRVFWDVRQ